MTRDSVRRTSDLVQVRFGEIAIDLREARSGQLIRADAYPRDLTEFPVRFAADPALGTFPDVALAGAFSASPSLDE